MRGARERGSEGASERGSEGARERGSEGGSEGGREGGTLREGGREGGRERENRSNRQASAAVLARVPGGQRGRLRSPSSSSPRFPGGQRPSSLAGVEIAPSPGRASAADLARQRRARILSGQARPSSLAGVELERSPQGRRDANRVASERQAVRQPRSEQGCSRDATRAGA